MAQTARSPLLATNLNTGLPNESNWQDLDSLSPRNLFGEMRQIGDVTSFVYLNNFGFNLNRKNTSRLNIRGIQVNLLRKGTHVKDFWIDLVYPTGEDEMALTRNKKASDNVWPFIYTDVAYGGPNDVWGRSWDINDINSERFGIVVAAKAAESSAVADLKRVEVVVYYDELRLSYTKKEIWQTRQASLQQQST